MAAKFQGLRSRTRAEIAQNLASIRTAHHGSQPQLFAVFGDWERADRNLTASAKTAEQSALAGDCRASIGVVQKAQERSQRGVIAADFDRQRSLPHGRTHNLRWDVISQMLVESKPVHARRREDD